MSDLHQEKHCASPGTEPSDGFLEKRSGSESDAHHGRKQSRLHEHHQDENAPLSARPDADFAQDLNPLDQAGENHGENLTLLKGLAKRVASRMEMPGRMLILRGVTAAHMTTGETEAQVDPAITGFQTLLAAVGTRGDLSYLLEMSTVFYYQSFPSFHSGRGEVLI